MAYEAGRIASVKGNVIKIDHPTNSDQPSTLLSAAVAASGTALTVLDSTGFADKDIALLGSVGSEGTEIKQESGAPGSATSITVAAVSFAHAIDTPVTKVLFNQVEISGALKSSDTPTLIATVDLKVDASETTYVVSGTTYPFYFVRYYNSLATTPYYGAYSDAVDYTDYSDNTVRAVKIRALDMTNEEIGEIITNDFLNRMLFQSRRDVHNSLKRWSFREQFGYDAGNLTEGDYKITLPTDMQDRYTNKNLPGVRIGTEWNLKWLTKREWDMELEGTAITTLASSYTVADAEITLTDSHDFDDDGSFQIAGDSGAYSANARGTGKLTMSTDCDDNHTAGVNVFQNVSMGTPQYYTIIEGELLFWPPVDDSFEGRNIWLDYYKTVVAVDSDADEFDEPNYDMYVHYLAWAIKKKKKPELGMNDIDYMEYTRLKKQLIEKEITGQEISLEPSIEHLD